jgi:hypothetical protein
LGGESRDSESGIKMNSFHENDILKAIVLEERDRP